jgi:predicted permease
MLNVFGALAVIAVIGASLHHFLPSLDIAAARRHCGVLVLNVLLPALNIEVLYGAPVDAHIWQIPLAMLAGIGVCVALALLVFGFFRLERRLKCSLILASAFGNVTYLGLPLLRGLFPSAPLDATEVAILSEVTVTSADLILGCLLAIYYLQGNEHVSLKSAFLQILKFPVLWSVAIAALLRMFDIPLPGFVQMALHLMGQATPGLMLLVLGMAIKPAVLARSLGKVGLWGPPLVIKLGLSPLVVAGVAAAIGLTGLHFQATTLEAAMPSQLFVLIVADRFGFDTEELADVVAVLTLASFLTLPIVGWLLGVAGSG